MKKLAVITILLATFCAAWLISPLSSGPHSVVSRVLVSRAVQFFPGLRSLAHNAKKDALVAVRRHNLDSEVPL